MVLVSLQTSGKHPPLFFVHGAMGVMPLGRYLVRRLGPDQPFYAVNASGFSPGQVIIESARDMVQAYVAEIISVRPSGPLIVAGMCVGGLIAIEIVRELQARDRKVGPVILADPPVVPRGFLEQVQRADPRQPQIARQLYDHVRRDFLDHASYSYNDMPFDCNNPEQMHLATLAGVGSLVALSKHVPTPFSGRAVLILSAARAPGFFHPKALWRMILPGPQTVHVLPWAPHVELFRSGLEQFTRIFNFVLKEIEIATSHTPDECLPDYASNA
jgi:thioesterase domain-containing protein